MSEKEEIENERRRINDEISSYPTPITACDAQFNHLLAEQTRINTEIDRLTKEQCHSSQPRSKR